MIRKILLAVAIAAFFPSAAFAAAQDQQVLLAQIAALQQQILSLQNAQKQVASSGVVQNSKNIDTFAVSTTSQAPRVCNAPTRTLSAGDENDDVANVQIFLARIPGMYPEGKVTGYYGGATVRAVQRFQAKYGILGKGTPQTTGWGYIGQKTLTLLRQVWGCGGAISSNWFSANPSHGSSPLSVVFSAQASSTRPLGASFMVDFGDGSKSPMNISSTVCNSIAGPCSSVVSIGHRYTQSGNYTAILTMEKVSNSCIAYPQSCPESATGFCTTLPPVCTSEKTSSEVGKVTVAVGTISSAVTSTPAALKVANPRSGASAQLGQPFSVDWASTNAPAGSSVTLSLIRVSSNANVGVLASGKNSTGSYLWNIPNPAGSGCSGSSIDCISQIGSSCSGSLCDIVPAVYKIRADLLLNGSTVVEAQSGAFAIGSAGVSELSTMSSSNTTANDGLQGLINNWLSTVNTNTTTNNYTPTGAMCLYSGVSYAEGISLYTTCEDAYKYSCASVAGKHLTCKGGKWYDDANGAEVNLAGITTEQQNLQGGCVAPWQNTPVAPNQLVPWSPYFTNGLPSNLSPMPLMKCFSTSGESRSPGKWQQCDGTGQTCKDWTP